MKLRLPNKLIAALLSAMSAAVFTTLSTGSIAYADGTYAAENGTNLGTIQFVGDSITHGSDYGGTHDAASWRWALHKIFVDNGITYSENGYHIGNLNQGNYKPVYAAGSTYGGVDWQNLHSAQASGRAYELIAAGNSRYNGNTPDTLVQNYASDRFFLLIGTNDTLSYYAEGNRGWVGGEGNLAEFSLNMLGCTATADSTYTFSGSSRMDTIVDTFHNNTDRTAGTDDDAPVVVLSIPTWSPNHGNNNRAQDFAAMAEYNKRMEAWAAQKDGVTFVDVNAGIVDVANTAKPGAGVVSMFNDGLHPSGQGDLIIAGNVAKNLGYAGRTAGLNRASNGTDGTTWVSGESLYTINTGESQTLAAGAFSVNDGYTVDFDASFGNGATDNWLDKANALTIAVGDGYNTGALKLSEGYISWGDTILYSQDNSAEGNDRIRIAYHTGDAANNVDSGYYVWLGDMLIGQALQASSGSLNGITLSAAGATGKVSGLTYSDTAYAPTTSLVSSAEHAFHATLAKVMDTHDNSTKVTSSVKWDADTVTTGNATSATNATADADGNKTYVTSLTAASSGWIAAKNGVSGETTGDLNMKVAEGSANFKTIFGNVNSGKITGNVTVELDSAATTIDSFATGTDKASVVGGYNSNITGTFQAIVNAGTLSADIIGGFYASNSNSIGAVDLAVNGGYVNGTVYGGSIAASGTVGDAVNAHGHAIDIAVTGGTITRDIIGSGRAGTVNGDINITLTGGIVKGSVIGKNAADANLHYKDGVVSTVTVDGNKVFVGGNISADNVTFKNVEATDYEDAFDKFSGAVTAADTLTLNNYNAAQVGSSVTAQHVVLTGKSSTTIRDLTLTACTITAEEGSDVTLEGTLTLGNTATYTGTVYVADDLVFSMTTDAIVNAATGYSYSQGTSGFLTVATATLLTPGDTSRLKAVGGAALTDTNVSTYTGAGALAGATFSYNAETGILSAAPVNMDGSGTFYVNDAVTYNTNTPAYEATDFVIGNGGNLTLATNLKNGVTIAGAEGATTSAITVDNGVTLSKSSVSGTIASYTVNNGGVYQYGNYGNTNDASRLDFKNILSGDGTFQVKFTGSGHGGAFVMTDANFTGTLDLSGKVHLQNLNTNTASSDVDYYIHDADIWWGNADITVAHDVTFGGNINYRPEGNTTFSGILTDDGTENFNWQLGQGAGNNNQKNKNVTLTNAGAASLNKVTLLYDNLTLEQSAANAVTDKIFSGNIDVNGGRTLTLKPVNPGGDKKSKTEAALFDGAVTLNGTAADSVAKIMYDDWSVYIKGGVSVSDGKFGELSMQWEKQQHIEALTGQDATLTMSRLSTTWSNAKGGYFHLYSEGDFSGTIKLTNAANDGVAGLVLHDNATALSDTVVDFSGSTNKALLAFISGQGSYNGSNVLTTTTFTDGAVAGLDGAKGSVKAGNLSIATSGAYTYSGDLLANKLTVSGTGSQALTGSNTISEGAVVEIGASLALGGTTTLGGMVTNSGTLDLSGTTTLGGMVTNSGTLDLSGTVAVNTDKLWNYEVKAAEGESTNYSDGANGFLKDATLYLVKSNGGTLNVTEGTTYTGKEVANDGAGNLTFTATDRTTYFVNTGALTYNDETMGDASNLYIAKDASLTANGNPEEAKVLVGDGTFNLATVTSKNGIALPTGVTLSSTDWQGIVHLTSNGAVITQFSGANISALGNANSWVELENFKGYSGTSSSDTQTISANLILKGENALVISDGYNNIHNVTGDIKGTGNLVHTYAANTWNFSGDISEWTGAIQKAKTDTRVTTLKFEGKATDINTSINYTGTSGFAIQLGDITNGAEAYTFSKDVKITTMTTNGHQVVIGNGATMTLTTALSGSDALKKAISTEYSGEGTLVFTTVASGDTFNDNAQLQTGGAAYTQGIDHVIINGNIGLNNWRASQTPGGLTIGVGKEMTVNGKMRVETEFDLRVQGALTVTDQLQMGHSSSGTAYVHILDGADVKLGGMGINNATNGKTFTMEGGTLTFTKDGKVFSDANATNTTASFAFTGGTLKAAENSWDFNHAATIGSVTLDAAAEKTLTLSGALTKAAGTNGNIVKTGAGTVVLSGTADLGKMTLSGGEMSVNNTASFTEIVATDNTTLSGTGAISLTTSANEHGIFVYNGKALTVTAASVTMANGSLYNNGSLTIGNGEDATLVKALYLVNGNVNGGTATALTIKNNATVAITGGDTNNTHATGIMFSEWNNNTTINVSGNLLAKNASVKGNTNRAYYLNIENGGVLAVQGITAANNNSTIALKDGGKLILGGTSTNNTGTMTAQAGSTIGISANAVTFDRNLTLSATEGKAVTIDTEKYAFNDDGTAIAKPAGEQTGGALTMSGVLSGDGALVKTGKGTLTLSGVNTYTGDTTVNGGTLVVGNANALGTGSVTVAQGSLLQIANNTRLEGISGLTLEGSGSKILLTYGAGLGTSEQKIDMTMGDGTIMELQTGNGTHNAVYADIHLGGSAQLLGSWYGDRSTVNGTIDGEGTLTVAKGTGSNSFTINSLISGSLGLTLNHPGTLTLSGANTFTGNITVDGGTLKVGNGAALGAYNSVSSATRTITINNGGKLDVNGYENNGGTNSYKVTLNGGTITNSGNSVGSGNRQLVTGMVLTADSIVDVQNNKNFGLIGANYAVTSLDLGANNLTKKGEGIYYLNRTDITGTGALVVEAGTVEFRTNYGHGQMGADIVLEGGSVTSGGENEGADAIFLSDDISITSNSTDGTFSANINTNGHTLTLDGTADKTLSGTINGDGGITKAGDNTITLTGAGTFTGPIAITGGTLELRNAGGVTLNHVVESSGNLVLAGNVNLNMGVDTSNATFTHGEGNTYGYLTSAAIQIATGGTVTADEVTAWSIGGLSAEQLGLTTSTLAGTTVTLSGDGGQGLWFMNTGEGGNYTYDGTDANMLAIVINAKNDSAGNTAALHLNAAPTALQRITVNDTAANIDIAKNITLSSSKLATSKGGTATLTGSGTFDLGSVTLRGGNGNPSSLTLPSGVSVGNAEHWTGVVSVSGEMTWLNPASLSTLCNANSWVEFKGVTGYFNGGNGATVNANLMFTNVGETLAYNNTGVFSGQTTTYNGKIAGEGTYKQSGNSGSVQVFQFKGDASAWTGTMQSSNTHADGNKFEIYNKFGAKLENLAGNMTVVFKNGAEFSGSLKGSGGTMKVNSELAETAVKALYISNGANVELSGGHYTIGGDTNEHGLFGGNGHLTIKSDADVTLNAHMEKNEDWQFEMKAGDGNGITIAQGSSFTVDSKHADDKEHINDYNLKVTGAASAGSVIAAQSNRGYRLDADDIAMANVDVELNKRENGGDFANKLENSSFTNTGSTAIALTNSESTITALSAQSGNITVDNGASSADQGGDRNNTSSLKTVKATGGDIMLHLKSATSVSLNELVLQGGHSVGADTTTNTSPIAMLAEGDETPTYAANIKVGGTQGDPAKFEASGVTTVNANLTVTGNTQVVYSNMAQGEGVSLNNNSLTLSSDGGNIFITDDMMSTLSRTEHLTLFTNVGGLTLNGVDFAEAMTQVRDNLYITAASAYFGTGAQNALGNQYTVAYNTVTKEVYLAPEPATTALSLLALAALAARRKRK